MSRLLALETISLAYGLDPLLEKANLEVTSGERVCLIGRNGAGKSSLLKIIDGTIKPDSGNVWYAPHLKIGRLEQELPSSTTKTVYDYVAEGLQTTGELLSQYHQLTHSLSKDSSAAELKQLEKLQKQIDAANGWDYAQTIETTLSKLALDADTPVAKLSGGWQRRAALAKALVTSPDLLLLDEPTNHLDIEAIQWLEEFLLNSNIGLIFITHDRALLQRLATRIIELDRGELTSWPGDYENFLRRKAERLHAEEQHNKLFDKKLAEEEKWIRQGIKARRTRNEGRVRALKEMRKVRSQRRDVERKASFEVNDSDKSGKLVLEAKHISQHYDDKSIVNDFSIRVLRGDRIGLIGPNGIGKSTLINLLLGKVTPQQGEVTLGTKLSVAYFDQLRSALDENKTVAENVVDGSDMVEVNGKQKHIIGYLSDFLFTPERARTPVKALSGGECNRLLLAKLFSKPANLLVMDEPTNDLDIETLELLEELLSEYEGTLLLVSHDREFIDNVVTSTLVFSGNGKIEEHVGGYSDWQRTVKTKEPEPTVAPKKEPAKKPVKSKHSLTHQERIELRSLPKKIETLEQKIAEQQLQMADADFYNQAQDTIKAEVKKLDDFNAELATLYARWELLEEMSAK